MPCFKSNIFYYNNPKIKLFLQKNAKFSSAGGSAPRPPYLRRVGALLPKPQSLAAGGIAPRPPLASGGLRAPPKIASPIANFFGTHLVIYCSIILVVWGIIVQVSQYTVMFVCFTVIYLLLLFFTHLSFCNCKGSHCKLF